MQTTLSNAAERVVNEASSAQYFVAGDADPLTALEAVARIRDALRELLLELVKIAVAQKVPATKIATALDEPLQHVRGLMRAIREEGS